MSLSCGLVGLPLSGKTTIFNLLTHADAAVSAYLTGKQEINHGTAFVPDVRVDYLTDLYKPQKKIYARIDYTDVPGLNRDATCQRRSGNQFLTGIRDSDALVYVLRAFTDSAVEQTDSSIDPLRDWNVIEMELLIADLDIIERNIDKIKHGKKVNKENQQLLEILSRCGETLDSGRPIHGLEFTPTEKECLQGYSFFTEKPYLVLVNVDENQYISGDYPGREQLHKKANSLGVPVVELCAKIESEINQLSDGDRAVFITELGIKEPGINVLAKATYDLLGLVSFFTVGTDEVRAWTIEKGIHAKKAAGKIHSDIEKGFIRAEVVHYQDIISSGTEKKAKEAGLYRLEGKDYIVQDGDIINFRFNV